MGIMRWGCHSQTHKQRYPLQLICGDFWHPNNALITTQQVYGLYERLLHKQTSEKGPSDHNTTIHKKGKRVKTHCSDVPLCKNFKIFGDRSGSFPLGGLLNHVKRQFIWNIDVNGGGEGHFATIFVLYLGLSNHNAGLYIGHPEVII